MAGLFASHALHYEVTIRARFGSTVCALMSCRLGIAIVGDFTFGCSTLPTRPHFRPMSHTARISRFGAMARDLSRLCAVKWRLQRDRGNEKITYVKFRTRLGY
jgi:hypothetical protein